MNWFRLKNCIKCQGDLASDEGDWICLQCGTYYYTGLYQLHAPAGAAPQTPMITQSDSGTVDSGELGQKAVEAVRAPLLRSFAESRQLVGLGPRTTASADLGAAVTS